MKRPVILAPYSPCWPLLFEAEKQALLKTLGATVQEIRHIGSTSVPGLCAKPVIDILLGLEEIQQVSALRPLMAEIDYAYRTDFDAVPEESWRLFIKGTLQHHAVHVHVTVHGSAFWRRHLLFRDYLQQHADAANAYARLKQRLAAQYPQDVEAYCEAKTSFIRDIETQAQALDHLGHLIREFPSSVP